jgi:replicative DNA helicase
LKLSTAIQEALVALLCYSQKEGAAVAGMVEARHFDPVYRELAELAMSYRERHRQPPGTHTLDLVTQCIERDEDRTELFERLFESVKGTAVSVNAKYVLDRVRHFVQHQSLKRAMAKAIRALQDDNEEGLMLAQSILTEAMSESAAVYDRGVDFIRDMDASLAFLQDPETSLPTGIPALDSRGLGPVPGRFHLYVAGPKSGKSWWLVNLATRAHQMNKRVLYVSLELSESELCQRLCQSFWAVSKRQAEVIRYRRFTETKDANSWGSAWEDIELTGLRALVEEDIYAHLVRKMKSFAGRERVIVKSFPSGSLSVKNLESYLTLLENRESFTPELLVVDYADIMKRTGKGDRWEGLLDIAEGLKRLSQERNIAVATASQIKASAAEKSRKKASDIGGAWDKIATADTVLTYSQTEEESRDSVARLYVAAARTDEDKFEVLVSQNYGIGQFVLSSIRLGHDYYKGKSDEDAE